MINLAKIKLRKLKYEATAKGKARRAKYELSPGRKLAEKQQRLILSEIKYGRVLVPYAGATKIKRLGHAL